MPTHISKFISIVSGLPSLLDVAAPGTVPADTLVFELVSQDVETATFLVDDALIVEESEWAVTINIPEPNFISMDAESVTVEA